MKSQDWLNKELPTWVRDGLITQDQAYQLSKRYKLEYDNAKLTFRLLSKIIGIGLGIGTFFFLLSLTWGKFSPEARLVVIILCFFAPIVWAIIMLIKKATQFKNTKKN
jgi:uncharacterized membrane protein